MTAPSFTGRGVFAVKIRVVGLSNFLCMCSNMKGFMVQGGDPTGTGKGGHSIWGGAIDDEFHPQNRVRC
jgi:cyclophilin family peptidyl-prolyl cis-trans isomerase